VLLQLCTSYQNDVTFGFSSKSWSMFFIMQNYDFYFILTMIYQSQYRDFFAIICHMVSNLTIPLWNRLIFVFSYHRISIAIYENWMVLSSQGTSTHFELEKAHHKRLILFLIDMDLWFFCVINTQFSFNVFNMWRLNFMYYN
jgi:hypothetical protein